MTTIFAPKKFADLSAEVLNFRGVGVLGTATAGTSTNIDFQLPEDRIITGGRLVLKNHVYGDTVALQVVDIDGVLTTPGTVLNQFASNWYVDDSIQSQIGVEVPYPAKCLQGLYIRLIYTSTGASSVSVAVNYFTHKVLA